jgi:branched-chain amino acid transport system permease protein
MAFSMVDPYTGFTLLIKALTVVVLAGLGSIPGAIVGGLVIGVIEALSAVFISASLGTGVLFLILACVLLFKPSGVFGKRLE